MKKRFPVFLFRVFVAFVAFVAYVPFVTARTGPSVDLVYATDTDTASNVRIHEVTVLSTDARSANPASSPLQLLGKQQLQGLAAENVGDAVKFLSGVLIKDYGGMGGMKTLSVRSMGAQHTAVSYDGVVVSDHQTGQTDLSRFSLDNVEMLSLSIGDGNSIFQPARVFASSGVLTIRTQKPVFKGSDRLNGKLGFKYGSYGQKEFSGFGAYRFSDRWSASVNLLSQVLKGDYEYRQYFGNGADDYDLVNRTNNRVRNLRVESTLYGHFGGRRSLEVKGYHYDSDRGLPGAVILYNPSSYQHLWDRNTFVQAHYEQPIGTKFDLQVNSKLNQTAQHYLNPDYLGASGSEDFAYRQEEAYLSAAFLFKPLPGWSFALASDGSVADMVSNLRSFSEPTRYSLLTNLSAKYVCPRLLVTAGLLATNIRETTRIGQPAPAIARLSPALQVSVQPLVALEGLRLRTFWKSAFREPSFNDLYYSAIGNTALKPENSEQLDAGLTLSLPWKEQKTVLLVTADAFHNRVTDKIMAVPTRNMFIWSMVNLGRVTISGLDLNVEASKKWSDKNELLVAWNHSYQRALDKTDPASKTYNQQIAYSPRIYGSGRLQLTLSTIKLGYSLLYSGHRYVTGQNLAENDLPAYMDQSLTAECTLPRAFGNVVLRTEVQNLGNENYELVRNFPMPGRTFRVSVRFEF